MLNELFEGADEMSQSDREMPPLLQKLNSMHYDYADGEGIDFEPLSDFLTADDTADWIRAWTGNDSLDGEDYLIFGQDGSGGYAAFWCVRQDQPIVEQPIVFLGSEGETAIIARNLNEYMWLLANNIGPYEAFAYRDRETSVNLDFTSFAEIHSNKSPMTTSEVLNLAQSEFPGFVAHIVAMCR